MEEFSLCGEITPYNLAKPTAYRHIYLSVINRSVSGHIWISCLDREKVSIFQKGGLFCESLPLLFE